MRKVLQSRRPRSPRLAENVTALFLLQAATMVLPVVTVPYLIRVLGPDNYGRVAVAQALIQYFVLLTDYGFNLTATRQVSACRNDPAALGELIGAVTAIKLCLLVAGVVPMLGLVTFVPMFEKDWLLYAGAYLAVAGSAVFPIWLLQGLERMRLVAGSMIVAQLVTLAGILAWVRQPDEYWLAATLQAAAPVFAGAIAVWRLRTSRQLPFAAPKWRHVRHVLTDGWHVFLSTAAGSLYSNTNILVLGLLTSTAAVGQFSAAEKLFKAVQSLLLPLTQSAYPHVARLCSQSEQAAFAFLRRFFRFKIALTALLSFALLLTGPALIDLLFGPQFAPSKMILQCMAPLLVVIGISNVLGVQTMLNFGMEKSFSRILVSSGLLNMGLLFALVPWVGVQGAAISLLTTEVVVMAAMGLVLSRAQLMGPLLWGSAN